MSAHAKSNPVPACVTVDPGGKTLTGAGSEYMLPMAPRPSSPAWLAPQHQSVPSARITHCESAEPATSDATAVQCPGPVKSTPWLHAGAAVGHWEEVWHSRDASGAASITSAASGTSTKDALSWEASRPPSTAESVAEVTSATAASSTGVHAVSAQSS